MTEALPLLGALLGAIIGVPTARWLRWVTYRKPDEEALPIPGSRWWVVPALAVTYAVLTWRVLIADPAQPGAVPADPGVDSPHLWLVRTVLLAALLVVALACACLAAMDFDVHRLPDRIMWPSMGLLLLGLVVAGAIAGDWGAIGRVVLAGLACSGGYLLLSLLSLTRGSLAVGMGDVKLAGLLGLGLGWFGWQVVLIGMYAGVLVGGLYALFLLVTRQVERKGHVAFGPPMMVGALLALVLAPDALSTWF